MVLLSEADEVPVVGEGAPVASPQFVEDDTAGRADAERVLEQIDEVLVRQRGPRHGLQGPDRREKDSQARTDRRRSDRSG